MPSSLKTSSLSLSNALAEHVLKKKVSFHTPGHKGFAWQTDGSFCADSGSQKDLSESVPGLDELAYPSGIIQDLEKRAAQIWGTDSTLLSVNGATAGILATILMLSARGTHIMVPRNCHRSVIHGLILSGLEPIWFEPHWQPEWGLWGAPDISSVSNLLKNFGSANSFADKQKTKIAGIIITSPTYAGALANIQSLSTVCDKYKIPLIVDEAHGAHLAWTEDQQKTALNSGAAVVIHSLHKTLSCPTQTGLVHISKKGKKDYSISESELRSCMNLIQSSSPNYLFMDAIDKLVMALSNGKAQERIKKVEELGKRLKTFIAQTTDLTLYESANENASTHILIKHNAYNSQKLQDMLIDKDIFPEALPGKGLLFLLGIGSQSSDIDALELALKAICAQDDPDRLKSILEDIDSINSQSADERPRPLEQTLSPRKAFFMPSLTVSPAEALGEISSECLAPCPPGWPILVPGQRITKELLNFKDIKSVRIVKTNGHFGKV